MSWTVEEIETLELMWENNRTCNEIANVINKSRNAVAGKVNRLGLSGRVHPITKIKKNRKPRFNFAKKMEDLRPSDCRWPIGDGDELRFCAAPVRRGSYCEEHRKIAYNKKGR